MCNKKIHSFFYLFMVLFKFKFTIDNFIKIIKQLFRIMQDIVATMEIGIVKIVCHLLKLKSHGKQLKALTLHLIQLVKILWKKLHYIENFQ